VDNYVDKCAIRVVFNSRNDKKPGIGGKWIKMGRESGLNPLNITVM